MAVAVSHAFAALAGDWDLVRRFEPGIGTMSGTARFTPAGPGLLRYREDGELQLAGGTRSAAWREYDYELDGEEIRVCFAAAEPPRRVLHRLRPFALSDVHVCAADVYTGRYDLDGLPNRFAIAMDVRGPAKGWSSRTAFTRRAPRAAAPGPVRPPAGSSSGAVIAMIASRSR